MKVGRVLCGRVSMYNNNNNNTEILIKTLVFRGFFFFVLFSRARRRRTGPTGGRAAGGRPAWCRDDGRTTSARCAQTAGPTSFAQHNVAEDRARRTGETPEIPIFPVDSDSHADDPDHRPGPTQRLFAAALPGVHVQQSHGFFLQATRR